MVKHTYCSYRGLKFGSRHRHWVLTTTSNSCSKKSYILFWPLEVPALRCENTPTHIFFFRSPKKEEIFNLHKVSPSFCARSTEMITDTVSFLEQFNRLTGEIRTQQMILSYDDTTQDLGLD